MDLRKFYPGEKSRARRGRREGDGGRPDNQKSIGRSRNEGGGGTMAGLPSVARHGARAPKFFGKKVEGGGKRGRGEGGGKRGRGERGGKEEEEGEEGKEGEEESFFLTHD
jgi:hypothetical protein